MTAAQLWCSIDVSASARAEGLPARGVGEENRDRRGELGGTVREKQVLPGLSREAAERERGHDASPSEGHCLEQLVLHARARDHRTDIDGGGRDPRPDLVDLAGDRDVRPLERTHALRRRASDHNHVSLGVLGADEGEHLIDQELRRADVRLVVHRPVQQQPTRRRPDVGRRPVLLDVDAVGDHVDGELRVQLPERRRVFRRDDDDPVEAAVRARLERTDACGLAVEQDPLDARRALGLGADVQVHGVEHHEDGRARERWQPGELEPDAEEHVRGKRVELLIDRRKQGRCDVVDTHRPTVRCRACEPERATRQRRARPLQESPVDGQLRPLPLLGVGERDQHHVVTAGGEPVRELLQRQADAVDRRYRRLGRGDEDLQVGLRS